ncbi:probable carboxylesterase 120 isoform X1 [Olea europaea subsp. europaea]|uniref:Probable carboxylesterase 120 isoform X1 n=1 Tax=Olea europaea subsp. europaea TaxID=158383 RepID=A0A8S0TNH3_OLEEU|nr:probable carboxylesterase 120 isoform X1 [Olea europaea subsp. europaea]
MSNQIDPTVDPYGYMGMARNPDGSITRIFEVSTNTPACSNPSDSSPVLSKDIPVNESNKTWVRVFLSRKVFDSKQVEKLPVIVYYHGGGLVLLSAATTVFHEFCNKVANEIPAVVVSQEYRLAPEHRLPAAYEDCMEALQWFKTTSDEWLTKYADFSKCYLMGCSAGGNIAYHVGLRAVGCIDDLNPVKIRGLILQQPFFGGTERTSSELRLLNSKVIPPCATDIMWELALPVGVDRDHEYCNPMAGMKSEVFEQIKEQGWKILITGSEGDPLFDRQIELAKVLKEKGLRVMDEFSEGGYHGYGIYDLSVFSRIL